MFLTKNSQNKAVVFSLDNLEDEEEVSQDFGHKILYR